MIYVDMILKLVAKLFGYQFYRPGQSDSPAGEVILLPKNQPDAKPLPALGALKPLSIQRSFLPINDWSRGGYKLVSKPKAVVVHWVANPNATAAGIRNYFATLSGRYASTHYVVGKEGEVIHMVPETEACWHVGARKYQPGMYEQYSAVDPVSGKRKNPNYTTLGIECCHIDWNGTMTEKTLHSLKLLVVKLLKKYGLNTQHLYLHRDFTGKPCHRYFVNNPSAWSKFRHDVAGLL